MPSSSVVSSSSNKIKRTSSANIKKSSSQTKKNTHKNTSNNIFKDIDSQCKKIVDMTDFHIYFFEVVTKNEEYKKTYKKFIKYLHLIADLLNNEFKIPDCTRLTFAVLLFYYLYTNNIYHIQTNHDNLKKIIDAFTANKLLSRKHSNKYSYFLTIFYEEGSSTVKSYIRFKSEASDLYNLLYNYYKIYTKYKYNIKEFVNSLFVSGFNGGKSITNWIEPLLILLYDINLKNTPYKLLDKRLKFPSLYENIKDINSIYAVMAYLKYTSDYKSQILKTFWIIYSQKFKGTNRTDRPNVIELINDIFNYINEKLIHANNRAKLINNKSPTSIDYKLVKVEFIKLLTSSIVETNINECEELVANVKNVELNALITTKLTEIKSDMATNKLHANTIGNECKKSELVLNCKIDGIDMGPICPDTQVDYGENVKCV